MTGDPHDLVEAIDRYGTDLASWRDQARAGDLRKAMLADRCLRARYDDALRLAAGLGRLRAVMDHEIQVSGGPERVAAAVTRNINRRRMRQRWAAIAAALVFGAALGSLFDLGLLSPGQAPIEVVVLDPLIFGFSDGTP